MDTPTESRIIFEFGAFELDTGTRELREAGVVRKLPPQPFRVLRLLAERAGHPVNRQEIRHCLWGDRKYVDVDCGINFCLNQIRSALRDPADVARCIKTLPRQGYCLVAPVARRDPSIGPPAGELPTPVIPHHAESAIAPAALQVAARAPAPRAWSECVELTRSLPWLLFVLLLLVPVHIARQAIFPAPSLTPRDTIVIADFINTTGDPIFDDTLKQALTTELRQSPAFTLQSASLIEHTLRLMGTPDVRVTPKVGRELCFRSGGKALLTGQISPIGRHYWMRLSAIDCSGGELLADAVGEAADRENVLRALAQTASRLRTALGESWKSVKGFEMPADVTTTSLQALQSYTLGQKVASHQGGAPSIPLFKRAIEQDAHFAMAYSTLGAVYNNLDQPSVAMGYAATAYALRERVSERERLLITTRYLRLTGELEKHTEALETWIAEYPNDASPHGSLGADYMFTGNWNKALEQWRESLRMSDDDVAAYDNLAGVYRCMDRWAESKAVYERAMERHLDGGALRLQRYYLAFLQGDAASMQAQVDWASGKPGAEDLLLSAQADTEGFIGRRRNARELSRRAVSAAIRLGNREIAALWQVNSGLREAELGNAATARHAVAAALALAPGRNVEIVAALALARLGDRAKAELLADKLEVENPEYTLLKLYRLPAVRAAAALSAGEPARALELLEPARPYELGLSTPAGMATLYPTYLRGAAHLALHDGARAVQDFEIILEHPGIAVNYPVAILAHLQLARALALTGDTAGARGQYQEFLERWRGADADLPALRAARAEVARL